MLERMCPLHAAIVVANGEIVHGGSYGNGPSGDLSQVGLIDEVGSFDGFVPLGPEEQLLFSLSMAAQNSGTVTFAPSSADESPLHDVLLFGSNDAVTAEQIMFVETGVMMDEERPKADKTSALSDQG